MVTDLRGPAASPSDSPLRAAALGTKPSAHEHIHMENINPPEPARILTDEVGTGRRKRSLTH